MKKSTHNQKIIWIFLFLAILLFLVALAGFFDLPNFKLNPFKINKLSYQFLLEDKEQTDKGKLISLMIFFNKEDNGVYLWLGDYYEKKGDLDKAVAFYQKAIDFAPLVNFEVYKKQLKIYEKLKKEKESEGLLLFLIEKIEKRGYLQGFSANLSKELYLTGKKYLEKGDWQETTFWWEKTTKISPEWSYFYLELASLYYQNNQSEKTKEALGRCVQRKEPSEHCREYLNLQMTQFQSEKPGFWREEILKIEGN